MNDHHHQDQETYGSVQSDQRTEPVRSRWTPKPEQILILESVFNSGMVNPPKEETVRIRKLLENFGSVGDANVFYWFQNRRARSRRHQRQLRASLMSSTGEPPQSYLLPRGSGGDSIIQDLNHHHSINSSTMMSDVSQGFEFSGASDMHYPISSSAYYVGSGSSSSSSWGSFDFELSGGLYDQGIQEMVHDSTVFKAASDGSSYNSTMHYQQPGLITVFINGVAIEVGNEPLNMKSMFGGDFVIYHSSGVPVQVNEYGFLVQSLQHGESYFLVPKH